MKGERWMAVALTVGVFAVHDSPNWLSRITGLYPWAIYFMTVAGGGTMFLAACLFILIFMAPPSFERLLCLVALGIWIFEGAMIPVCGIASGFTSTPGVGVNLCDYVTGWPVTKVTVGLEVAIIGALLLTEMWPDIKRFISYMREWYES